FFSSRRRHTRFDCDWSSDVCSSDLRAIAERARIILASASGAPSLAVAEAIGVTRQTVGKWRTRFLADRLDGLLDAPRPGAPRTKIGRASCRERVERSVGGGAVKEKR